MILTFDVHSHILPSIDDGSKNIEESIKILEIMKAQGITEVAATSHFYAGSDSLEVFLSNINNAYEFLLRSIKDKELPQVYLGCEVLYFRNIGRTDKIRKLTLNNSDFLLLELTDECINNELFEDILNLRDNLGIISIIAHIERYYKAKNFKKLLKFVKENNILTQINASSLLSNYYSKAALKLVKNGIVDFIATDSHSATSRAPQMSAALKLISEKFGNTYADSFIANSNQLLEAITEEKYEEQSIIY